jgi:hypothetical protein
MGVAMGAWGALAFDNDQACDWAAGLADVDDLSLVEAAFAAVENADDGYVDAHEACDALAACEVLARLRGHPGYENAYTRDVDAWVASHRIAPLSAILTRAEAVIDRVLAEDSELRELWDEGDGTEWRQAAADLRRRLRA